MALAWDHPSFVIATIAIVVASLYTTYSKLTASPTNIPSGLPWVGVKAGWLATWKARAKSFKNSQSLIEEGYRKYSKGNLSFILPSFSSATVVLPQSGIRFIVDAAEHVLNAKEMQKEGLQSQYSLLDSSITDNPIHELPVRRELTRALGGLIPEILDELQNSVDKFWGCDTDEWKEVVPFADMMSVVSRASNRIFVGLPLCRNNEFLTNAAAFAQDIVISAFFLRLIPQFLKPVLAWIPLIPNRRHFAKCAKHLLPLLSQRLAAIDAGDEVPNDLATWYIQGLAEQNVPADERKPEKIALRLMTLNFAAIHTSTFTATNIIFDLFSTPPEKGFVEGIREEVTMLLQENGGIWDKNMLAKMIKTDSAVRESLRISTFLSYGMNRLVIDPKGVTMENGLHLPQGTKLATPVRAVHHDDSVYENARTYDAFRFSQAREDFMSSSTSKEEEQKTQTDGLTPPPTPPPASKPTLGRVLESRNLSTVTTSDTFLSFGHGRHACPGRFFAATEMKLLLAYIIMNYDIKPLETRPPNSFIGGNVLPPMKASIQVRRRKGC